MASEVLHLTKRLRAEPRTVTPAGVNIRHFVGNPDVAAWLRLRENVFGSLTVSPQNRRRWNRSDFAREFFNKKRWKPQWMWFAESRASVENGGQLARMGHYGVCGSDPLCKVVGTVTMRLSCRMTKTASVGWLMVEPEYQGMGIGRCLVGRLEHACWESGIREIRAQTLSDWSGAVAFYRAIDFEVGRPDSGRTA